MRYQASVRPGFHESFAAMFPAPRQRWVDNLASPEEAIRALPHETLILHGREDEVIPLEASLKLAELIDRAQLHVLDRKSTRLNSSHVRISYAVFCLKK